MNQILDYNPVNNGGNRGNGGSHGTDKIIKVFAILLILFAICLIGIGINNKIQNSVNSEKPTVTATKATITTNKEGETLKITVSHDKNLSKLLYNWNTTTEKNLSINSGKNFDTIIDIPAGNNTLYIQVIDEAGNKTEYSEEITSEGGVDIIEPTIEYKITEDKKLEIKVKDETAIDFLTYRWNDEDEVTIKAEDEQQLQMVETIDIKMGTNNLTIIAVDKANNTASVHEGFTGQMQPIVQVTLSADKSKLEVLCTHENGISKINYTLNDKPYAAELPDSPKEVRFEQPLDVGYNKIILTVTSIDNTSTTFGGECTYTPEDSGLTIE